MLRAYKGKAQRVTETLHRYLRAKGKLSQAWGQWLSGLAEWDWFVTMTFKDPAPNSRGWTKPGWATAKRAWGEFLSQAQPTLGELAWVRCFEIQGWRGVPHVHALVGNCDPSVRRLSLVDWAWDRWGMARVLEYDPELGARYYLGKYLVKGLASIDFGGILTDNSKCAIPNSGAVSA